jgi:ketosteroid isomerase-like protein
MRFITVLMVLLAANAGAQNSSDAQLVQDADRDLNELISANNAKAAESFYVQNFILTTSSGKINTRENVLHKIASADPKLEINQTDDVQVRVIGSTAVLTGVLHQKGSYQGRTFDALLRVTDTWVRTDAGWKLLAGHAGSFTKT